MPAPAVVALAPVPAPAVVPLVHMHLVLTVPPPPAVVAPVALPADAVSTDSTAVPVPPAPAPSIRPAEPFKLPAIPDVKSYLNLTSIIQYYLWRPEFSTQRSDDKLITDSRNAEASAYWEGQLRVALQDGSLCYIFKHMDLMYDGKRFEMLAALNLHCCPETVPNAFKTLMSLFNDNMGDSEDTLAFRSRFDGMMNKMSRCKIVIPQILMVMFFLRSLHSHYSPLLNQFRNLLCSIKTALLDSIVLDVHFHHNFTVVGNDKKASKGPKAAAAAVSPAGPTDQEVKPWNNHGMAFGDQCRQRQRPVETLYVALDSCGRGCRHPLWSLLLSSSTSSTTPVCIIEVDRRRGGGGVWHCRCRGYRAAQESGGERRVGGQRQRLREGSACCHRRGRGRGRGRRVEVHCWSSLSSSSHAGNEVGRQGGE